LVYVTMFITTLAISGIAPFAGFFSKDAILAAAFASEHYVIWGVGTLTAMLTAFYMFRMLFIVFFANGERHALLHSLPAWMAWPLVVLAVGSATAGLLGVNEAYGGSNMFASFIALPDSSLHLSHTAEYLLGGLNVLMGLLGMGLAYRLFAKTAVEPRINTFWKALPVNKFYIDELYAFIIVKPLLLLSRFSDRVIDRGVFDAAILVSVWGYRRAGHYFARLQNGKVRYYSLYILAGVAVMSYSMLSVLGGV